VSKLISTNINIYEGDDRLFFERQLWSQNYDRVMGLDEVGRGCLAGPVVASGVILRPDVSHPGLRDSKQILHNERIEISEWVKENALFWYVSEVEPKVIDQINILQASFLAMMHCVECDDAKPEYLLIDGNRFVPCLIPHQCIVKGDNRSASIAAASILAKTTRDHIMQIHHENYPMYGWNRNVGYPTKTHFAALLQYGYTDLHRKSFSLRTEQPFTHLSNATNIG